MSITVVTPIIVNTIAKASLDTPNINTPIANNIKYKQITNSCSSTES